MQSPMQEIAERVAEAAPGLAVAANLEAIQNFRQSNADARRRLQDSHRWQATALGMTVADAPKEEDMGNLVVCGDVYGSDAAEIIRSLQAGTAIPPASAVPAQEPAQVSTAPANPATQPVAVPSSGWARNLSKAALVAAGLLGGGGIGAAVPWFAGAYSKPAAASIVIAQPAESRGLEIEVVKGGAMR